MSESRIIQHLESIIESNTIKIRVQQGIIDSVDHQILYKPRYGNFYSYDSSGQLESLRDEPRRKIQELMAENSKLCRVLDAVLVL